MSRDVVGCLSIRRTIRQRCFFLWLVVSDLDLVVFLVCDVDAGLFVYGDAVGVFERFVELFFVAERAEVGWCGGVVIIDAVDADHVIGCVGDEEPIGVIDRCTAWQAEIVVTDVLAD